MLYPTFYLDAGLDTQQLEAVSKNLGSLPGGSQWQFFTTSKGSLGRLTPLEALPAGKLSEVMVSAEGFAERGVCEAVGVKPVGADPVGCESRRPKRPSPKLSDDVRRLFVHRGHELL